MIRVQVTCMGRSPLMMDPMDEQTLDDLIRGVRRQQPKDIPFEKMAEKKIYRDDQGNIAIPANCLFACLKEAGRKVKNGRGAISTATSTTLPMVLSIEDLFLPLLGNQEWVVDKRAGKGQQGTKKVAIGIIRPRFDEWGFTVTIMIDDSVITEDTVRDLFRMAGRAIGLCAFRPSTGGQFGCFNLTAWNHLDDEGNIVETMDLAATNGHHDRPVALA